MQGRVYIVTHKKIHIPMIEDRKEYEIIQSGDTRALKLGYLNASTGENIAEYNAYYAELTVYYWIWKNVSYDYIGINHYRRFLYYKGHMVTGKEIEDLLSRYEVLVPQKARVGMTMLEHWKRCHATDELLHAAECIKTLYPEYEESIDKILKLREFHICNMMITSQSLFNAYCEWVFPILEQIREQIDFDDYPDAYAKQVGGFLSERLLNIWLYHNRFSTYELELKVFGKNEFNA